MLHSSYGLDMILKTRTSRITATLAGTAMGAAVLMGCWEPSTSADGQAAGCEIQHSKHDGGFVTVDTKCSKLQERGEHQQAGVRCDGQSAMSGGNMVYANGGISSRTIFCGTLGYQYAVLVYDN